MIKNILNKKYNLLRPIKTQELVRLGKNMVGGYVVDLSMIEKTNILITCGFGPEWSFESDFIKMKDNCNVFIYDHNLSSTPYLVNICSKSSFCKRTFFGLNGGSVSSII